MYLKSHKNIHSYLCASYIIESTCVVIHFKSGNTFIIYFMIFIYTFEKYIHEKMLAIFIPII